MPDSSAGTPPRSQPAKPFSIGHRPLGWLERRRARGGGRSQLSPAHSRQLFNDKSSELEDVENYEEVKLPSVPSHVPSELESAINGHLHSISPSRPVTSFSPKPGSLAEAVSEIKKDIHPVQRGVKWYQKAENEPSSPGLFGKQFYKQSPNNPKSPILSGPLSERDINAKVNRTGKCSTPYSKRKDYYNFPEPLTIDDSETDLDRKKSASTEAINESSEVVIPEKLEPHMIGLKNRGNTCYLNSTLQALLGLPMVVTDATNLRRAVRSISTVNMEAVKLVSPFTSLCLAQAQGQVSMTNDMAASVKTDMEALDSQFAGHKMQDANEFLCRFMDELKENTGKIFTGFEENPEAKEMVVMNDNGFGHTITNLVDTNFMYEKEEQFVCCRCDHMSSTKYTDVNFFLDVSDASLSSSVSIQHLVEKTLAPEVREKRCEKCGHETATTTTRLVRLPKVMLLYLKRYKYLAAVGGQGDTGTAITTSRKVTRLVDIPDTITLAKMVSEDVKIPDSSLPEVIGISDPEEGLSKATEATSTERMHPDPLSSPVKQAAIPLPFEGQGTPIKFKGKTEEELSKLSEEEQTEYLLFISQKEAVTSSGREDIFVTADEEEDLKQALAASLLEVTSSPSADNDVEQRKSGGSDADSGGEFKTPTRKRRSSISSSSTLETPPSKMSRSSGASSSERPETRRGDTPTPGAGYILPDSPVSEKSLSAEKKQSWKRSFHRPETKAEEEADMLKALELSTQESLEEEERMISEAPVSSDNNADNTGGGSEVVTGPPEFCFKLSSIVSHFGASTAAGHYVADVQRFDAGGWFRYDDTNVTETNEESVRTGSNKANGYIFMYVHTPLWDQCNLKYKKINNDNNNIGDVTPLCDSSV